MTSKKFFLLAFSCIGMISWAIAQDFTDTEIWQLHSRVRRSSDDTAGVNALLRLAEYYITKPGEEQKDIDSALLLIRRAEMLSAKISYTSGTAGAHLWRSAAIRERGNYEVAKPFAEKAVELSRQAEDQFLLGKSYMELANFYSPWDDTAGFMKNQDCYEKAHAAFKQCGNLEFQAYCLKQLADLDANWSEDPMKALSYLHQALAIYKTIDYKKIHGVYDLLGFVYSNSNDFQSAIRYGLLAVQTAEKVGDTTLQLSTLYNRVGRAYYLLKDYQSAKVNFLKALQIAEKHNSAEYVYDIVPNVLNALIKLNELSFALKVLNNVFPHKYDIRQSLFVKTESLYSFYVLIYTRMKNYEMAGKYYSKMLGENGIRMNHITNYFDLPRVVPYLVQTKQYAMAERCLNEYKKRATESGSPQIVGYSYILWFKLDSARENYLSAINHFQKHKEFEDSISEVSKSKLVAVTRVEYETARKDQDIKIKAQSIDLLTKTNEIQKQKIEKSELLQNTTLAGIALLLIVFGLLYNQYRIKQRNNREISRKNITLQRLVDEKELLLKEVHHRVKNNLHIVMSLLESQSAYLKNDALLAIQNSQNRVYAMSLIHQKLYQSKNVTRIDMGVYLPELIHHLRDSFDLHQRIRFDSSIEKISLDISQAIPVGLIINEAVTNCMKYAFPGGRRGRISVEMTHTHDDSITLIVSDDGIGLPPGLDYNQAQTLGMKLMKGLSEDIQGKFSICTAGDSGTRIQVIFEENRVLRNTIIQKQESVLS